MSKPPKHGSRRSRTIGMIGRALRRQHREQNEDKTDDSCALPLRARTAQVRAHELKELLEHLRVFLARLQFL